SPTKLAAMPTPTYEYFSHPLADLLPMMEATEFANLKADISKNGIQQRVYEGKILDGRNRYKAAREVGHKFVPTDFKEFIGTLEQAEAFVWSANYSRRHLTTAQKQTVIRQQIEKYPSWSNRKIARHLGLSSHATVAAVRDRLLNPPEKKKFEEFKK